MPPARVALALFAALTFLLGPPHAAAQEASSLDEPLCPTWIEELLFNSTATSPIREDGRKRAGPA